MKKVIIVFMLMFIICLPQLSFSDTSDKTVNNKTSSPKEGISAKYLFIANKLGESYDELRISYEELKEVGRIIDEKVDKEFDNKIDNKIDKEFNIKTGHNHKTVIGDMDKILINQDDSINLYKILISLSTINYFLAYEILLNVYYYEVSGFNEEYIRNNSKRKIEEFKMTKQLINAEFTRIKKNYINISKNHYYI